MLAFDPTHLARWTSGKWTSVPVVPLRGFSIDSRGTRAGEVFVALKSATRDGHDFVAAAAAQGAAARGRGRQFLRSCTVISPYSIYPPYSYSDNEPSNTEYGSVLTLSRTPIRARSAGRS